MKIILYYSLRYYCYFYAEISADSYSHQSNWENIWQSYFQPILKAFFWGKPCDRCIWILHQLRSVWILEKTVITVGSSSIYPLSSVLTMSFTVHPWIQRDLELSYRKNGNSFIVARANNITFLSMVKASSNF